MLRHYYTLEKIAEEIAFLKGCLITECFTQEKNIVIMCLSTRKKDNYLQLSTDANLGGFFYRDNYTRAKSNTVNLFSTFLDQKLLDISLFQNDRIVDFRFEKGHLLAVFFGGPNSNIIAVDDDMFATEAFKKEKMLTGKHIDFPQPNLKHFDEFSDEETILKVMTYSNLRLGRHYAEEFCLRKNIDAGKKISDFSQEDLEEIKNSAVSFSNQIRLSGEAYIYRTESEFLLSLIPLQSYPDLFGQYSSVNKAAERKVIETLRHKRFFLLFTELKSNLKKRKEKLSKNLQQMKKSEKHEERLKKYRLYAELLSAVHNPSFKGAKSIILPDYEGNDLEIPLDEKLSLMENSAKYFEKIKKAREAHRINEKRQPLLEKQLKETNNHLDRLFKIDNVRELEKFKKELTKRQGIMEDREYTKFREFDLGEGCILYAGKNAANNDVLTMKFAKPNDIWLHARGSGGSHCVLRLSAKEQKPPKYILEKAAQIAAYYSQARNAKYTPVAYTQKKYVRKPKGANPGSVVISRENVIMVEPKLPE